MSQNWLRWQGQDHFALSNQTIDVGICIQGVLCYEKDALKDERAYELALCTSAPRCLVNWDFLTVKKALLTVHNLKLITK